MEPRIGWPDVALALIEFAKTDTITFLLTVPFTGSVILAGAFLFLRIIVIRPVSMMAGAYNRVRRTHRGSARPPELPLE
jgi:hypothetical protein